MSIIRIEATSRKMQLCTRATNMTLGRAPFDRNLGTMDWKRFRRLATSGLRLLKPDPSVPVIATKLGGRPAVVAVPEHADSRGIVLYIHGGGFVSGDVSNSKAYCSMLAAGFGCKVYGAGYTLSPEAQFPTALNDVTRAYKDLTARYPEARIALIGESAGGNLVLALTLRLMQRQLRLPALVIAHSPVTDLSGDLTRENEIRDFIVREGCLDRISGFYLNKKDDRKAPEISPLYGDLAEFPPLILSCDEHETLFADARAFYDKAEASGVDVTLYQFRNTFHAAPAVGSSAPEMEDLLKAEAARFRELADMHN